ncbi:MAG TPA: HEAT repeat domain-containing protein [Bryobacteraceae bacterium]|nr:HEAT repeat domain-containing protein [Bryobacteraceae bacterium]
MNSNRCNRWLLLGCLVLTAASLPAQQSQPQTAPPQYSTPKERSKYVKDLGKTGGSESIPKIAPYLADPNLDVRLDAVKAIVDIGTESSLDPLIKATHDNDPEIQIRATDGLVNFYLPGYVKTGLTASLRRAGSSIKGKFSDRNNVVVDGYVHARPEIIAALGQLATGGASMDARANAARALGILRGRQAVPQLEQALRTKDTQVIYESLVALEKIRDESAGPQLAFLLHDLNEKVQLTAIEATGLLLNRGASDELRDILDRSKNMKVKRAALTAMAQMPDPKLHGVYVAYLDHKDEGLREAAAEGLGRLKNPDDLPVLEKEFSNETKTEARLSDAFALVDLGKHGMGEFDPLRYLVNNLNSAAYRDVAIPYLTELARDPAVRQALYPALKEATATKDEKTGLAQVLAASGGEDAVAPLQALSQDSDNDVAQAGLLAVKNLRARLP